MESLGITPLGKSVPGYAEDPRALCVVAAVIATSPSPPSALLPDTSGLLPHRLTLRSAIQKR